MVRIVSGGQTGPDRAALDVALRLGIGYGGWCPRGGAAEDLPRAPGLLARYPALRETPARDPAVRTAWNVRDSDATLVLRPDGCASQGTDLTTRAARDLGRPLLVTTPDSVAEIARWLAGFGPDLVLNVAGPRESEAPGLYAAARATLLAVLGP